MGGLAVLLLRVLLLVLLCESEGAGEARVEELVGDGCAYACRQEGRHAPFECK